MSNELLEIYAAQHDVPYIQHSLWHFNSSDHHDYVQVLIFYETEARLEEAWHSPQRAFLKAEVPPRLIEQFPKLGKKRLTVSYDSLERVQQMGGWLGYYK